MLICVIISTFLFCDQSSGQSRSHPLSVLSGFSICFSLQGSSVMLLLRGRAVPTCPAEVLCLQKCSKQGFPVSLLCCFTFSLLTVRSALFRWLAMSSRIFTWFTVSSTTFRGIHVGSRGYTLTISSRRFTWSLDIWLSVLVYFKSGTLSSTTFHMVLCQFYIFMGNKCRF